MRGTSWNTESARCLCPRFVVDLLCSLLYNKPATKSQQVGNKSETYNPQHLNVLEVGLTDINKSTTNRDNKVWVFAFLSSHK